MKKIISLVAALALLVAAPLTFASYGGGGSSIGSSLQKDTCPNGDYSNSYYDNSCGTNPADVTDVDDNTNEDVTGVTLDGYIFFDENRSGAMDNGEQGVQGAVVTLKSSGGSILDTDVSTSNGYYAFYNVMPGTYKIHVSLPATKTTFVQDLLAVLSPSVSAANDYEFTVVIGADDSGTINAGNIPVVDGEATVVDTTNTEEELMDDDKESILDIIKNANANNNTPTSSIGNNNNAGNGGFALPAFLPNTGASL